MKYYCSQCKYEIEVKDKSEPMSIGECGECGSSAWMEKIELIINPYLQVSDHFQAREFACNDGTPIGPEHINKMSALLDFLERLRFAVNLVTPEAGEIGIDIVSGYRHPAYNEKVGGAENSGHLFENGAAADIRFTDRHIPVALLWQLSIKVDESFPMRAYRLGNYEHSKGQEAWVHVGSDFGVGGTRWFK